MEQIAARVEFRTHRYSCGRRHELGERSGPQVANEDLAECCCCNRTGVFFSEDCSRNQTGNTALNVTLLSGIAIEATEPAVDMGCHLTPDSEPHIVGRRGVWSREHRVACWTSTAGSGVSTKKRTGTLSDEDSVRTVPVHSVVRNLGGGGLPHVHSVCSVAADHRFPRFERSSHGTRRSLAPCSL